MAEIPVKDKIEYTVSLLSDFAKKHSLSTTQAFNYPSVEQALRTVYNSELNKKLCDPKTGLYFQSPLYVYEYLKTEIKTVKLQ